MQKKFILAIDSGTTATSALLINEAGEVVEKASKELTQYYPETGWVEHDAIEIWGLAKSVMAELLDRAGVSGDQVAAIGITNQRETTILWERETLKPVHRAIVWQCRRTADICNELKEKGYESLFREKTGLVLDPYFSGTKLKWLLDHVDGAREAARAGRLAFGTVDTWLLANLTGGAVHATEPSNASRTLLFNIKEGMFDPQLAEILDVPMEVLPQVFDSSGEFGVTKGVGILPDGIPIAGIAGDQQAALFGQGCVNVGEAKCTYGTGAFVLMNTGDRPVESRHGLLTTVAWRINGKMTYALEGSAFIAGAAVQWLRDGLKIIKTSPEVEDLARTVDDNGGVVFVPALAGLGAPYWRPDVRGGIFGITRGTTTGHIARAVLEGIALEVYDLINAMQKDLDEPLKTLKVDGGASQNNLMMQFQADILRTEVVRPKITETTAYGAGLLAGMGVGFYKENGVSEGVVDRIFRPEMDENRAMGYVKAYHEAINRLLKEV